MGGNTDSQVVPYEAQSEVVSGGLTTVGGGPLDITPGMFKTALKRRSDNRKALVEWIREALVDGVDFGRIHVKKCPQGNDCREPSHWSKPSLWKPGADKICGMLGLRAVFPTIIDYERMALDGKEIRQILLRCELLSGDDMAISTGIGARDVSQDYGNLNKALKMAAKSAHIDATLRAAGLSELFTLDIEDIEDMISAADGSGRFVQPPSPPQTTAPPEVTTAPPEVMSDEQVREILELSRYPGFDAQHRAAAEKFASERHRTRRNARKFIESIRAQIAAIEQSAQDDAVEGEVVSDSGSQPEDIQLPGQDVSEEEDNIEEGDTVKQAMALRVAMPEEFDAACKRLQILPEAMTDAQAEMLIKEIDGE